MKIVNDDYLRKIKENGKYKDTSNDSLSFSSLEDLEKLEEYDKLKSTVLKYVIFKKRTEYEVRQKFQDTIDSETLDSIITTLKENNYIDDTIYIKKAINEFIALRNLSCYEISNKLYAKGIKRDLIDDYMSQNRDEMREYELQSCKNIILKKVSSKSEEELINFLYKKGYKSDIIRQAIEELK